MLPGQLQHFLLVLPSFYSVDRTTTSTLRSERGWSRSLQASVGRFLPALDCARFLTTPRGSSTANDALALSMLAVGATHLSYLHRQTAVAALDQGQRALALEADARTERFLSLSRNLEASSMALQTAAILLLDPSVPVHQADIDDVSAPSSYLVDGLRDNDRCFLCPRADRAWT